MVPKFGAYPQGANKTFFRVWAPNAKAVDVVGEFSNWRKVEGTALAGRPDGFWEGQIDGLGADDEYEFLITKQDDETKRRLDPAARDTRHSSLSNWHNKSRIVDTRHDWTPFEAPPLDDLIIYQCHVGTFAGYRDDRIVPGVATIEDISYKLDYIRGLGFNAVELLPVQEFRADRSWGYNPAFYFALESA